MHSQDEIAAEHGVMCCKRPVHETEWVSFTPSEDQHHDGLTHELITIFYV